MYHKIDVKKPPNPAFPQPFPSSAFFTRISNAINAPSYFSSFFRFLCYPCRHLLPERLQPFHQRRPHHMSPQPPPRYAGGGGGGGGGRRGVGRTGGGGIFNIDGNDNDGYNHNGRGRHQPHHQHPRPAPPLLLQGLRQQLAVAAAPINLDDVVEESRRPSTPSPVAVRQLLEVIQ